jgi:3-hydroxyacyl-CoA dehydrogenase
VRPLETIGVIGGGTMGSGIAVACLLRGFKVVLLEQSDARARAARETIAGLLEESARRGLIEDAQSHLDRLQTGNAYDLLRPADLVIEAVFEDMEAKKQVFAAIEATTRPEAIIATNTSYLDVNEIAATLSDPSRAMGLHFFSPAHIMKLLEIVVTDTVADDVLATAAAFAKRLGKIGVLAGVCDGFIGNRIMSAYRHEADILLEEGADPSQVDSVMRDFGFAMGIFEMQDLAGLDIAWAMRKRRAAQAAPAADYVLIADRLCAAGRFGRKTGAGGYDYEEGGRKPSPVVASVIAEERAAKGIAPRALTESEIMDRIIRRMKAEAEAVVQKGIAQSMADIDVVMVNGYGFPRWRGGPGKC